MINTTILNTLLERFHYIKIALFTILARITTTVLICILIRSAKWSQQMPCPKILFFSLKIYKSQFSLSALSCPPMKKIAHRKPKKTKRVYPLRGIAISDNATVHNNLLQCFGIFHCNGIETKSFRNLWNSIYKYFSVSFPLFLSLSFSLCLFVCFHLFNNIF